MEAHSDVGPERLDPCESCGDETPHEVRIEVRARASTRGVLTREPYRVATCVVCGNESTVRMNNA